MQTDDDRRARRAAMVFGKAKTFADHEEQGIQFWRRASMAERFEAVVQLVSASWYLQGQDGPPPRLDRATHGARRLGG